jgi:hypothetical protein
VAPFSSRGGQRAPLVGRQKEVAAITEAFGRLTSDGQGVVLIVAEPGAGKSRRPFEPLLKSQTSR